MVELPPGTGYGTAELTLTTREEETGATTEEVAAGALG